MREVMKEKRTILQATLDQIIRRIVEVAKPEKIILFGSAARGEMGPHSDVDLLVIKSGAKRLDLTGQIYRNLHGVGEAVDVVVVTPEDVERYHDSQALIIAPALKEGRVVYAAYPGLAEPVTEAHYQEAVASAEAVVRWAEERIP
jgi:predicted nucleotidyltransferase